MKASVPQIKLLNKPQRGGLFRDVVAWKPPSVHLQCDLISSHMASCFFSHLRTAGICAHCAAYLTLSHVHATLNEYIDWFNVRPSVQTLV